MRAEIGAAGASWSAGPPSRESLTLSWTRGIAAGLGLSRGFPSEDTAARGGEDPEGGDAVSIEERNVEQKDIAGSTVILVNATPRAHPSSRVRAPV